MNLRSYITPGLILFILLSPASVWGDENTNEKAIWEDYRILSERNIFSRNRVKVEKPVFVEPRSIQREPDREEGYLVLRGVTKQADQFVAFIEDSRTMEIRKVLKNGIIGKGKIKKITLDYITYELEGKSARVNIGMTMGGEAAESVSGYDSGFEAPKQQDFLNFSPTVQEETKAETTGESAKDILQRLKERRKKELGE
jgi:hypothetical protein